MMISWYVKVDLEQTQRLVEREEGLSLAHKFNCSFYETSAAHRFNTTQPTQQTQHKSTQHNTTQHNSTQPTQQTQHNTTQAQLLLLWNQRGRFIGITCIYLKYPFTQLFLVFQLQRRWLFLYRRHVDDVFHTLVREIRKRDEEGEFKENETSRWKKVWNNIFKTIKRGRRKVWEKTFLFNWTFSHLHRAKLCIFQLLRLFRSFRFWTSQRWNLKFVPKFEICTKKWNFLSFSFILDGFAILRSRVYFLLICAASKLLSSEKKWSQFLHSLYKCWFLFQGNLIKQHCFYSLNVTNIIDITSHALLLIYHRKRTLWESAKFGQTPWILPDDNVAWFYLCDQVTHNQPKMHSISIIVWKGPPYVSMYCNDLTGVNC